MTASRKITKLLIANRGEIALRILRAAKASGIKTLAVYSDADRGAPYVKASDEAVHLVGKASADTYLRGDLLIDIATRYGANAIHPGYGFLSEQAEFARAVEEVGLIWVGPKSSSIQAVGSKSAAKSLATNLGIPVLEAIDDASDAAQEPKALATKAVAMGSAVMVKAVAGGGGRGMRLLDRPSLEQATSAIASAKREASAAFGSDVVILERALLNPRHVEVQILADEYGQCLHLGERDCSVQRRNQKIIEEAPSPGITKELRESICANAVKFARAAQYCNAGTVEFLVQDGQAYLMEMNTRIQVEHPVSEAISGIDLVQWQLRIAQGEALDVSQEAVSARLAQGGHAIEVRLCAEDEDFTPQTGTVQHLRWPVAEGLRIDSGIATGSTVSPWYDSMLAKVIAHAPTRTQAIERLIAALSTTEVAGLSTNRSLLIELLRDATFASGEYTVPLLSHRSTSYKETITQHRASLAQDAVNAIEASLHTISTLAYPFARPSTYTWNGETYTPTSNAKQVSAQCQQLSPSLWHAHLNGQDLLIEDQSFIPRIAVSARGNTPCIAKVNGRVVKVLVKAGDELVPGQALVVIESMKLEQTVSASSNAVVDQVFVVEGEQVKPGQTMVKFQS